VTPSAILSVSRSRSATAPAADKESITSPVDTRTPAERNSPAKRTRLLSISIAS
jgi:hypothetical protein